jgi:hypothetical protein
MKSLQAVSHVNLEFISSVSYSLSIFIKRICLNPLMMGSETVSGTVTDSRLHEKASLHVVPMKALNHITKG